MKHIKYSFSSSDVEIIIFTLSVLPSLQLEETQAQADINYRCCISAAEKLVNQRTDILPNEFRVIFTSLLAAQQISQGEITVDSDIHQKCCEYIFSINKLVSIFEKQLS